MSIDRIKSVINNSINKCVKVVYNEGRNKVYVYYGRIIEAYNNIFIVFDINYGCKRSFSYYDVLTNTVKLFFNV